jgi:nucleotide-binding universal stress UspA family protein
MSTASLSSAIEDFRRARQKAALRQIFARFRGEPVNLLSYEEVRQRLKTQNSAEIGLREVPLEAIVGSVNRYNDFTRDFLPLSKIRPERWARIEMAATGMTGLPPVELYKIGDIYFVKDGNHRISVARELGAKTIQAYVTELQTRVPLTPDIDPEQLILKAEYADFLEKSHLDEIRPGADLSVSETGQYPRLEEHISVHRYYMGLEQQREISYEEAVAHWYDTVYLPVAQVIENMGVLRDFPGRTEADLYLWISEHRSALEMEMNRGISPADAARDLSEQYGSRPQSVAARITEKLKETLLPDVLESGPPAGQWRRERGKEAESESLFADILVPLSSLPNGWSALQQAIEIARREVSWLHGLHVVESEEERNSPASQTLPEEFKEVCQQAGVEGALVTSVGDIATKVCEVARFNDLLVVKLNYPPATHPLAALSSGFRSMLQRCPRPLMAVPEEASAMNKALLAYDRSSKAREALYVATYLAGKWQIPLVVVSVNEKDHSAGEAIDEARAYLNEHGIQAKYREEEGDRAEAILTACNQEGCDFLLMGGYGYGPVLDVVLGSTVNEILRQTTKPVLICR